MSDFFRQFTDDQMALMLCGFAILGSWCLLQISFYVGRSSRSQAEVAPAIPHAEPSKSHDQAA